MTHKFMKERFNHLLRDRIVKISYFFSFVLIFLAFLYIIFIYQQLPPLIPVFNQLPWGIQRLGEKVMIFLPFSINLVFFIINIVFSLGIYKKMPLVVRMLSITTLFISFTVLVFLLRTTFLII